MSVLIFVLVFIAALFAGSALAYPLYVMVNLVVNIDFPDVIILSTQLAGLAGSLLYLKFSAGLSLANLGYRKAKDNIKPNGVMAFIFGFIIVVLLGCSLYILGIYDVHSQREFIFDAIPTLIIGAIATGIVVATFEETVFRGALLRGLEKQSSAPLAVIMTSLVYAWVHFIQFDVPSGPDNINLLTASVNFINAYSDLLSTQKIDAFFSLFILGMLLGMMRIHQKSIIACIALHAGLVAGIKIFRYLLEYQPDSQYQFLVSHHDYRLGFMATVWLFLATFIYYFYSCRKE
ncbi:MAG: CPBP family intramembrane metalloprotease [Gammaproteobacteria bacterium]|nr:CPBP family intramembrane metalloprotease [Gammaproteobacteria bacterium]